MDYKKYTTRGTIVLSFCITCCCCSWERTGYWWASISPNIWCYRRDDRL